MARKKQSDEAVIAAMISCGTITAAADKCGISARTIYTRLKNPEFRQMYQQSRNDVIRGAVKKMDDELCAAVDAVAEIMKDPEVNPATRLQAAQTILNNAGKLSDRLAAGDYSARVENRTFDEKLLDDLMGM